MRAARLALVSLLTASAAATIAVAGSTAADAAVGTYTAVTASGNVIGLDGLKVGYVQTGSQVSAGAVQPDKGIEFIVAPGGTYGSANVGYGIAAASGATLTLGTFPTTSGTAAANQVQFEAVDMGIGCTGTGSINILQADTAGNGNLLDFAANYSFTCSGKPSVTGELRWNSTVPYTAIAVSPDGWDFGSQTIQTNGTAKTLTVTNAGATSATLGTTTLSGTVSNYSVTADACSGQTLAASATCAITVVPHPAAEGGGTTSGISDAVLSIPVTVTGDPTPQTRVIYLQVQGTQCCPLEAIPAPGQITLTWSRPGVPFDFNPTHFQIFKGTSGNSLVLVKSVVPPVSSFVDFATPGTPYYYAIKPVFGDGSGGELSPIVAAEDWPKYSDGVYHRYSTATRFISSVHVTAGHPYTMSVLGLHGLPASGVQAIAVNIEASASTATTGVYAYPTGTAQSAPDLVVTKGTVGTNFAIVKLGSGGKVTLAASAGTPSVTIDIEGYFATAALTTKGYGQTLQDFIDPFTIIDTRNFDGAALGGGQHEDGAVDFADPALVPHVTSLLVQIMAYGSTGSGSIAGYEAGTNAPGTTVLTYRPNAITENTAIIPVGVSPDFGPGFPAISVLNRGTHSVQLYVSVLGFFDDNTLLYGARYVPETPYHLLGKTVTSNSNTTIGPGANGNIWTTALMTKMADYSPTATSAITIAGLKTATTTGTYPAGGQLRAPAHMTTVASTVLSTGFINNEMRVHNSAGNDPLSFWVFGRFDGYPQPDTPNFSTGDSTPQVIRAAAALFSTAARG